MSTQHDEIGAMPRRRPVLLWWDLGVATTVVVLGTIGVVDVVFDDEPGTPLDVALAVGALALLVIWYLGLGRSVLRRAACDETGRRVDDVYLGVLVLLIGAATVVVPNYATLQAVAYPMIWTVVPRYRDAVVWSAALALSVGGGFLLAFGRFDLMGGLGGAAVIALLSFTFAVVMGTWITRIFQQGERYRLLAEQLRASQAEVSALSEQAGAGRERERLSRELHDTLTQTLAGLVMLSEQADRALAAGDADLARDRVARVESAAREAVAEARALVATTQPLGDGGLEAAIERVVSRLRADTGLDVSCELQSVPLDRERQVVLLRAVQEGLANARRHANASRVHVQLEPAGGGGALLRVDDDGVGPVGRRPTSEEHRHAASGLNARGADVGDLDTRDLGAGGPDGRGDQRDDSSEAGGRTGSAGEFDSSGGFGLSGLAARARVVGGAVGFGASPLGGARLEVRLEAVRGESS